MSAWDSAGPLVVGHRGGRGAGWPRENTLAAFEQARAEGARAIELDVRTCRTGEVVVHHDPTTRSLDELRAEGVPTLAAALAWAVERDVAVNVEMKHDVPSRLILLDRLRPILRRAQGDILLSSFDPLLLAGAAVAFPALRRALSPRAFSARTCRGPSRSRLTCTRCTSSERRPSPRLSPVTDVVVCASARGR